MISTAAEKSADNDRDAFHILLVEDDAFIAKALRVRLEAGGHRVSRAADVACATEDLLDIQPDVVLMDVNLPDGNGLALAARMQHLKATSKLPMVIITASRDPAYRQRASELGVDFLEKPFTPQALLETIRRVTDKVH